MTDAMIRTNATYSYAACIRNTGYPASLERHKIYRVLSDPAAESEGDLRIVDESGEDYLYPASGFVAVEIPEALQRSLVETDR